MQLKQQVDYTTASAGGIRETAIMSSLRVVQCHPGWLSQPAIGGRQVSFAIPQKNSSGRSVQ